MVGSGDDPNKRLAMYWSDGDMTDQPPGTTSVEYAYPSVEAQQADPDSLLNSIKAVNRTRLDNQAIADGENEFLLADGDLCLMRRTAGEDACLIAINFASKAEGEIALDGEYEIAADLEVGSEAAELENGLLMIPAYGIAVLRRG